MVEELMSPFLKYLIVVATSLILAGNASSNAALLDLWRAI